MTPGDEPQLTGREHWLWAEAILTQIHEGEEAPTETEALALSAVAQVHALLALAAPAYAFHVPPFRPVPANPDTVKGNEEITTLKESGT